MSINYYPIIKWKKGEQEALRNFDLAYTNFYPIIEIVDECSPIVFFTDLSSCYSAPIYFDLSRFQSKYLYNFIVYAADNDIQAYPIFHIQNLLESADNVLPSKFSVKIPISVDFEDPTIIEILKRLSSYKNREISLILDAGEVIESRIEGITYKTYCKVISDNIEILSEFENIIICLTSFPERLSIESGKDKVYERYDILIFKKIIERYKDSELHGKIQYSDYGVTKFTKSEIDFSKMQYGILPKVKYTTGELYIVKKGAKDRIRNVFTRSYIDIAREIVNSPYFYGQNFSYGDQCIYNKATLPKSSPGNPQQWVTYCANHHFTLLMEQLSNLSDF